ncbi:P-loop containing nucleoside triphosphate hydrolase protein [Violaceomyces palustris]|uniref:P-loop containing nucleoside triphosphate hydrolase protein n=1 Tax=Violaceomyces palustris TaxID=1673888 RepID=A0ACD0NRC5_9BASI|nr:P-loop containing nucleoside triphosphate hydrolase protein [Violaceomyces palustris]
MDQTQLEPKGTSPPLTTPERPSKQVVKRWIQTHLDLLLKERKEEQDQTRLLLSKCPAKLLEREGLAILGLEVKGLRIGLGDKVLMELGRISALCSSSEVGLGSHGIRNGDLVLIEEDGGGGVVYKVLEDRITIAVSDRSSGGGRRKVSEGGEETNGESMMNKRGSIEQIELPERVRVVKVANEVTFDRMERNLERLAQILGVEVSSSFGRGSDGGDDEEDKKASKEENLVSGSSSVLNQVSPLISSLVGLSNPTWSKEKVQLPLPSFNSSLNPSQLSAISLALSSNHFCLIHGPPGTGKTTALVELIMQLALGGGGDKDLKILVCGASNLAVDNLLERIVCKTEHREALRRKGKGVTRLGHPARVLSGLQASTLDSQTVSSSEGQLVKDVTRELEEAMNSLRLPSPSDSTTTPGNKSKRNANSKRLRGAERRKRWEEVRELRKEYRKRERGVTKAVLDRADIVLSTCHGAGGKQLLGREFDYVIIDEACQALEAACWIPILKAKKDGKVILAGDHLQLPPTVKSTALFKESDDGKRDEGGGGKGKKEESKKKGGNGKEGTLTPSLAKEEDEDGASSGSEEEEEGSSGRKGGRGVGQLKPPRSLEETLFSRLLAMYGQGCKALLSIQYRMNEEIMSFPNQRLYRGKLEAHQSCKKIRLTDLEGFEGYRGDASVEGGQEEEEEEEVWNSPLVFYDTAGSDMLESEDSMEPNRTGGGGGVKGSKLNENEVEIVKRHVELLSSKGLDLSRVTILSPYSSQVGLISSRLRGMNKEGVRNLEIGTVDGMQGREKDVVILSLVRSNPEANVGFLKDKRRLNVAMTRARRQLVVVADSSTVGRAKVKFLTDWIHHLENEATVEVVATMDL